MSFFAPWRSQGGEGGENAFTDDLDSKPLTAPGGWSNLLTWRPTQRAHPPRANSLFSRSEPEPEEAASSSISSPDDYRQTEGDDDDDDDDDSAAAAAADDDDHELDQRKLFTARTRQRTAAGGVAARSRAPIPFEMEREGRLLQQPRRKGKSSSIGSFDMAAGGPTSSPSKRNVSLHDAHVTSYAMASTSPSPSPRQGVDSADVSAALVADTSADFSIDGNGALDSAFQTLSRIRAKDVAASASASASASSAIRSFPSSSTMTTATATPTQRRVYRTPNESPLPSAPSDTWMQWGTDKIRSTLPRGLASALFAVTPVPDASSGLRPSNIDEERDSFDGEEDQSAVLPRLVRDCIDVILALGDDNLLDTEGLFRVSPSNALLQQTKDAYDRGKRPNLRALAKRDRHLPAALLKAYLRSLDPPLIDEAMYDAIIACPHGFDAAIDYLRSTLWPRLDYERLALLRAVMECMHEVSLHSRLNRMDAHNLAIVVAPSMVHSNDVMRDVAMCSVPAGGAVPRSNGAGHMTLGMIFVLCTERFTEVFEDDSDGIGDEQYSSSEAGDNDSENGNAPMSSALGRTGDGEPLQRGNRRKRWDR